MYISFTYIVISSTVTKSSSVNLSSSSSSSSSSSFLFSRFWLVDFFEQKASNARYVENLKSV